jgi:hypothetical protein
MVYPQSKDPLHHPTRPRRNGQGSWAWDASTLSPPPSEWLNAVADKGPKEVRTHQPISEQSLDDITQRL